jgi:uncharacterized protein DUF4166
VEVVHGRHPLTPFFVSAMKLPSRGDALPVRLRIGSDPSARERNPSRDAVILFWRRQMGSTGLDTRQYARHQRLVEESGPGSVEFVLHADADGSLRYEHAASCFLRLRLPRVISPRVSARVSPTHDGWSVDVVVEWRGHLICRYRGSMRLVDQRT